MSITSGYTKYKRYQKLSDGTYQLVSQWTSSNTVHFDDGATAEAKIATMQTAIDGVNTKVNNLSELSAKQVEVLNERMNTFTALEDGSTTGDAELIDARIDKDGNIHENVGEHIRNITSQLSGENAELKSDLDTLNQGGLVMKEDFIAQQIYEWLNVHPEATTTVQDESLTYKKLVKGTLGFVCPEMFGAKGDGITDDTEAIQRALDFNSKIIFLISDYYLGSNTALNISNDCMVVGNGTIHVIGNDGNSGNDKAVFNITNNANCILSGFNVISSRDTIPYIYKKNNIETTALSSNVVIAKNNGTGTLIIENLKCQNILGAYAYSGKSIIRNNIFIGCDMGCYGEGETTEINMSGNIFDFPNYEDGTFNKLYHYVYAKRGCSVNTENNKVRLNTLYHSIWQLDTSELCTIGDKINGSVLALFNANDSKINIFSTSVYNDYEDECRFIMSTGGNVVKLHGCELVGLNKKSSDPTENPNIIEFNGCNISGIGDYLPLNSICNKCKLVTTANPFTSLLKFSLYNCVLQLADTFFNNATSEPTIKMCNNIVYSKQEYGSAFYVASTNNMLLLGNFFIGYRAIASTELSTDCVGNYYTKNVYTDELVSETSN